MDAKKIGIIALVVIGLAAAAWSAKTFMFNEPAPAGTDKAAEWRERMGNQMRQGSDGRPARPGPPGVPQPQ